MQQSHARCRLRPTPDRLRLTPPRLLPDPSSHPALDLGLRNDTPVRLILKTLPDLLADIDVVLDVLEGGVLRKLVEQVAHLLLRRLHGSPPFYLSRDRTAHAPARAR